MTYHYVTGGPPGQPVHKIVWKGNLGKPIATCSDHRDAQRICDALNNVPPASSGLEWHRVEDQMPDDDMLVLVYVPPLDEMIMAAHVGGNWYSDDSILIKSGITHWCDPTPPSDQLNNHQPTTEPEVHHAH